VVEKGWWLRKGGGWVRGCGGHPSAEVFLVLGLASGVALVVLLGLLLGVLGELVVLVALVSLAPTGTEQESPQVQPVMRASRARGMRGPMRFMDVSCWGW